MSAALSLGPVAPAAPASASALWPSWCSTAHTVIVPVALHSRLAFYSSGCQLWAHTESPGRLFMSQDPALYPSPTKSDSVGPTVEKTVLTSFYNPLRDICKSNKNYLCFLLKKISSVFCPLCASSLKNPTSSHPTPILPHFSKWLVEFSCKNWLPMKKYLFTTYSSRPWGYIGEQDNLPALLGTRLLEEAGRSPLGPNTHRSSWKDGWLPWLTAEPFSRLPHPGAAHGQWLVHEEWRAKAWSSCLDLGQSRAIPELPMGLAEASVSTNPQFFSLCPVLLSLPPPVKVVIPINFPHANPHHGQFPGKLVPRLCG